MQHFAYTFANYVANWYAKDRAANIYMHDLVEGLCVVIW